MRRGWVLITILLASCGSSTSEVVGSDDTGTESTFDTTTTLDTHLVEDTKLVDTAATSVDTTAVVDVAEAGAGPCPADMVSLPGFCMDKYEAPNVAGAQPLAMQTAFDGEAWCKARGKRLCSEAEWVRACNGKTKRPYPYGTTYAKSTCNDDKTWKAPNWTTLGKWPSAEAKAEADRLYQADESGKRTGCVSEEGVVDLTGNVAEWVTRSFPNANNYDHVMKGCYWSGCFGGAPPSCAFVNPAHPGGFRTYEAGFRCCQ